MKRTKNNKLKQVMDKMNMSINTAAKLLKTTPHTINAMRTPSYHKKHGHLNEDKIKILLEAYLKWLHKIISEVELYLEQLERKQHHETKRKNNSCHHKIELEASEHES
jgi:hypothetical protein